MNASSLDRLSEGAPRSTVRQTWFGRPERPIFGSVEIPTDGRARGGAVLCPAIGHEAVVAARSMRLLSARLADAGIATLRFAWSGTGNSCGDLHDDIVTDWIDDVRQAVGLMQTMTGSVPSLVGLRIGALVAAQAVAAGAVARSIVLWDPPLSGRDFLRRQQALFKLSVATGSSPPDGVTDLPALRLPAGAARAIRELRLEDATCDGLDPQSVLAIVRPELSGRIAERGGRRVAGEVLVVNGQAEMVEVSNLLAVAPVGTIQKAADFVATRAVEPVRVTWTARGEAVVAETPLGKVIERIVETGPHRLPGIVTIPPRSNGTGLLAVDATSAGPDGLWAQATRLAAARGSTCLRSDRRGMGDASNTQSTMDPWAYTHETIEDVSDAIVELRALVGPALIRVIGLCVSAWASCAAVMNQPPEGPIELVSLSQVIWTWSPDRLSADLQRREGTPDDDREDPEHSGTGRTSLVAVVNRRARQGMKRYLPYFVWNALGRRQLAQVPEPLLAGVARSGAAMTLVFGDHDAAYFRKQRGHVALRRLRRRGARLGLVVEPLVDHSLFSPDARARVLEMVDKLAGG